MMVDTQDPDDALVELRGRLHAEYDGRVDPAEVDRVFVECSRRLTGARISTYVPVLVEKQVRESLRRLRFLSSR